MQLAMRVTPQVLTRASQQHHHHQQQQRSLHQMPGGSQLQMCHSVWMLPEQL
jgi:hypothetical protein